MTVKAKLQQLNEDIQKMYYESNDGLVDIGFFSYTLPNIIKEIKDLMVSKSYHNDSLIARLGNTAFVLLDNEIPELKKVEYSPSNRDVTKEKRDLYLKHAKQNVDKAVLYFISFCTQYDKSILEQIV